MGEEGKMMVLRKTMRVGFGAEWQWRDTRVVKTSRRVKILVELLTDLVLANTLDGHVFPSHCFLWRIKCPSLRQLSSVTVDCLRLHGKRESRSETSQQSFISQSSQKNRKNADVPEFLLWNRHCWNINHSNSSSFLNIESCKKKTEKRDGLGINFHRQLAFKVVSLCSYHGYLQLTMEINFLLT